MKKSAIINNIIIGRIRINDDGRKSSPTQFFPTNNNLDPGLSHDTGQSNNYLFTENYVNRHDKKKTKKSKGFN